MHRLTDRRRESLIIIHSSNRVVSVSVDDRRRTLVQSISTYTRIIVVASTRSKFNDVIISTIGIEDDTKSKGQFCCIKGGPTIVLRVCENNDDDERCISNEIIIIRRLMMMMFALLMRRRR